MDEEDFAHDPDMPEYDDSFADEMEQGADEIDDRDESPFEDIPENWAESHDDLNGAPEGEGDF